MPDGNLPVMTFKDLLSLSETDGFDYVRENEFRRGYRDGYLAAVDALFDLAWLKTFPRAYDHLRDFADGPLFIWQHGDRERIIFPPVFAVPCRYCGNPATVLDHVVPRSKGGDGSASNLAPCCYDCNRDKGNKDVDTWRASRKKDEGNQSRER